MGLNRFGKVHINPETEGQVDITGDDNLVDFKIEDDCYVNDAFLGSTITKKITVDIINPDNEINLENKEISVETGIKYHENIVTEGKNLTLKEEKEIPLNLEISGNSEQETRSGKNLLELMEGTYSNNGITAVVKDGVITLNGTATAISFVGINLLKSIELTNDKAYHLSAFNERTVGDGTNYCSLRLNQDNIQVLFNTANVNGSITTNLKISYITIRTAQGITYNNFVVKPQLELGAGTNEWEQGGAMPSPNHKSEIKTVGSNVNLFDLESYYNIVPSANCTKQLLKNGIRLNFTAGNDAYIGGVYNKGTTMAENQKAACIKVKPNTTYTLKMSSAPNCYMSFLDKDYKAVKAFVNISSNEYVFSTDSSTEYIYLRLGYQNKTSGLTSYDFTDIKCVEGTEVGEYSKHGQGCVKVTKCNKNIWNLGNKGNNSGDISFPLKSGKYTLSFKKKRISNSTITNAWVYRYAYIRFYDKNDTLLSSIKDGMAINLTANQTSDRQIIDFTAPENTAKMIVNFSNNNGDNNNNTESIEIQLEGEKATSFEQHQEQSYIMPIQQEMLEGDYFDWDNEDEVHIFGKKVLTGNENWEAIGTNTSGKYRFQTKVDDIAFNADGDTYLEGICDSYKVGTPNTTYLCQEGIATVQNYLIIYNEKVNDTVENFEKGLSNKNVTIYYKLATPTRLPFTDEQKAVAKELNNARTYEGITHIYSTDSIAPVLKTTCGSEIVPFGNYIIPKPENEEVKGKTSFVGYDYMSKFDVTYVDDGVYPIKLYDKLNNLCKQVGIKLGIKEIVNGDYEILGNPFTNNETCKTVLSNIAQLACGFAKIGRDNKLYIITLSNKENINEVLDANCYMDDFSKNDIWGEVNSLIIRLSQVEGENTTIQDEDSIQKNGLTEITISDNYFLKDSTEREKVIQNIWESIKGLRYLPFSTTYYGFPYLDVGDMIKVFDIKDNEYTSYVFNHEFTYNGSFAGTLETKALTKTQTALKNTNNIKTKFRNVEYKVNKIDGKITSIIEQQTDTENKITQAQQDIDGFTQKVYTKDEVTEKVNELKHTIDNITFQQQTKGGGNIFFYAKEYWKGSTDNSEATLEEYTNTLIQQNNISDEGYLINNGVSIQSQVVKNGSYAISFNYYKLKADATGYIKVNDTEYKLDGNAGVWNEKTIIVEVTTNNIKIEIGSDTVASYYIADLMVATGTEKSVWTQNANETRTDTVEIGKGIQVNSSTKNTYTRIDADGNRTFNSSTNERVAEMTDKGVYTKQLEVKEQAKINLLLMQQVGNQIWLTGLEG